MKIIIIRHGDPDYAHDSLTEQGRREAVLLAKRLSSIRLDAIYCSPLGRAKLTASYTLAEKQLMAETCDWLREFAPEPICKAIGETDAADCVWDHLPEEWTADERFFDLDRWTEGASLSGYNVKGEYKRVCRELDTLLAEHGYEREGRLYRAVRPSHDTVCFFCHFGVESVLLSHLLNMTPMQLWHGTCALPTGVTTLVTEERREGLAYWRMTGFGDVSHLTQAGLTPSRSALFCECFTDPDRHD